MAKRRVPSSIILGLSKGQWTVGTSNPDRTTRFDLDDLKGLRDELVKYTDENGAFLCPIMHSSSLDFPEDEEGIPQGFRPYAELTKIME
jgi:hypothetical protein